MKTNNLLSSKNRFKRGHSYLNEEDTLGLCLSLETVAKNENFTIEAIVADNGSQVNRSRLPPNLM